MKQLMHAHGGDLDSISKKYQIRKENIIDFSGNINPLGFPKTTESYLASHIQLVSSYPDRNYEALKTAISSYTGANSNHIVVGNGSTELISTFIQAIRAKKTLILGPAYSEYEREATLAGSMYTYFPLEETNEFQLNTKKLLDALLPEIGLLILCNPNNPTGSSIYTAELEKILYHCRKNNTAVLIDETYIEFSEKIEKICAVPLVKNYSNLFVIRGISKFFAAPGLRLGYGISSNQDFLTLLSRKQNPWSVNSLAAAAGEHIFQDSRFILETKRLITQERKKAYEVLAGIKHLHAYPSDANFILLKLLHRSVTAKEIFEHMIQRNMLIRDAASFTFLDESFLRFCFRLPEENSALLQELKILLER